MFLDLTYDCDVTLSELLLANVLSFSQMKFLACVDNEASAGAVQQQQLN